MLLDGSEGGDGVYVFVGQVNGMLIGGKVGDITYNAT